MTTDVSTALATLQLDPDNSQALAALAALHPGNGAGVDTQALSKALGDARRFHRERGDFELCVQLIDQELAWTADPARRADLLHEKGRILSDELLRDDAGQACVREALQALAGHGASTESLAQMSLVRSNWEPISQRYLQQAEAATDKTLASSLFLSVAEFHLKYGGGGDAEGKSGEEFLRKSLELDPRNRRSSAHLERLWRERGRNDDLLALYRDRAALASREERALAEVAAGDLCTKLARPADALEHYRAALEADPHESRALRPVRDALAAKEAWPELAQVLEAAARSKRGEQDIPLLVDLAMLLWRRLGQKEQAEPYFRRIRKADPSNRDMVEFYREHYAAETDLPRLISVLAQAQKTETDVDRRVAMGIEMARAAEARPQHADKAIEIWKGLLRLRAHLPDAVAALRRLYTRTEKWNALLELLKDDLDAIPAGADAVDEKINRYLEIVAIYRDHLNLDVMVVNTYLNVLALKADHPQALAALATRYEAQGRWSDLIQILGRQAEAAVDPAARVALHRKIASLWAEKLGKHGNAVASLEKILEADPSDVETSAKLKELYAKSRAWRPLLDVYRKELPFVSGDGRRTRLSEMARIAGERLNDVREAISIWNQVLAVAERDPDALSGLSTLYERERRWPALVEILDRQRRNAEIGKQPSIELALLERRGTLLYEKLGATQAAIEVFRRIQALAPQNARATRALREIYAQSGDFTSLEALYVEQGAFTDLCDQLTSLADRTADMGARTRLLERVASVAQEKLNQPERALKAYERILATDPGNRRAALALVPLYRTAQKWPRLLATYEVLLGPAAAADNVTLAERLDLLTEARRICEQRLASKGLAFQWCARAFEAAPKNEEVRADLERLAGEADEWGALAALYAKRVEASTDADERLWLLRRSLRVASSRLYKPAEGRRWAEQILAEIGQDDEAEAALEQIFTQSKSFAELAKLLHGRADRAPDIGERAKLLFRIAQLEEEKVSDLAAAAATLGAIVEAEPGNERALRALVRVSEARQDWAGLVEALRRELALRTAGGRDDREELLLRIGQIQETRLHDLDGTFTSYREVLQANPHSAAAVAGLERLGAAGYSDRAELARLALPLYERTGDAAKLAAAHETLLAVADSRGERVERLEKLRALYAGPLADGAAAYRVGLALFEIDPSDAGNRVQLIDAANAASKTGELVERVRALASATDDQALRRDLLVTVAELQEQKLGRSGDAEKVYAEILQVEPLQQGAFRALSRLYRDGKRWPELRALLEARQGAVLDVRERLELLADIAELDESQLGDTDHALGSYEKMLELDPADLRAHRALDRLYAARERWQDLEELLGSRVRFASGGEEPELEFRRAELRATRLGDVEGALDLLEAIVRTAPSHEGARRLLEKLLATPDQRQRTARILAPLYEAAGAWARLVSILEIQREGLTGAQASTALARIADLQENKLQARAAALATWRQVLVADPANPDALTEIERLATSLERFQELVDVYQELAFGRDAADIRGRADLLARAARLYEGRLGNKRAAIDAWKLVLNLDPEGAEIARPAAGALEALYAETGDVAALVRILRMQARWAESAEPRKAILFRIAGLEERSLGDTDASVATLRAVLEIDPQDREAIDGLERIFEAGAQHRQRVEILRKRIDLANDPAARQDLWRRVASLLERDVGDVDEAIAACVSILDENPEDASALETLGRLYDRQGRHHDRLGILERRLALTKRTGDVAPRIEILRQIADLLEGPLGDPADALERWREILPLAPSDPDALAALERFLQPGVDAGLRLAAAQALEPLYERAGRFAELAAVIQVYVEAQSDPHARLTELVRLAGLQEQKLRDPEAAFATTALAIRDALAEPGLGLLLDSYERLAGAARLGEVAALYREMSPDVLDEGIKLRLERFVAETARRQGDAVVAGEYYRRVLDRVPEDDISLAALEQIYRDGNDAEALYEILARRAERAQASGDAGAEQRLRLQIGQLAEQPLGHIDEAITAYERVLEIAPRAKDALDALDRLYTQAERWGDLTRFLAELLDRGGLTEREVVGIRYRLAEIEHDRQHDRESSLEHLRVVLRGDPDHPGAIKMLEGMLDDIAVQGAAAELLEPVYAGRGDWPSLIKIGEIRLLQVEEPAERVAWTKRIARLYEEQLEDYDSALKWYGKVFQESPTERLSSDQLLRLAGKLDRWQDVASLFSGYLADELSEEQPVLEIVRRTAEIFDLRLGNRDEARKYYRRLFDARPDDREVAQLYEGALERWESWYDLRELLDEEASRAVDPAARLALLRRSAKLDETALENRSRAITTLRDALDVDPADRGTAAELERLLRAEGLWSDLSEHLAGALERAGDVPERDAVALRLADVLESQLADVPSAIDRYAEILERTPGSRDAVAALERIAADPDHRYRIAVILEPIYRRSPSDVGKLVGALEAQLDSVEDHEQRVRILREMAEIHQRLGRAAEAFECRSRAWLVDVSSPDTLAEMEALGMSARLHAPLAEALQKGALEANDPDLQAQLWAVSARLCEEQLADGERAIEAWRSALSARPDDVLAFLALERLLSGAARSSELVEVLEKHLEIVNDPDERKAIAKRIAVLYEQALKEHDKAVRAWETVLEVDLADSEALDALAELHLGAGAFRELADIYERKIQLAEAPAERRRLRLEAAPLYDEKLSEVDRAIDELRAILEESAGDPEALAYLDRLYTREGRHADLLDVLDARAAGARTPAERDQLAFRAARLLEVELGDVDGAIGRYQKILAGSPAHADARAALWAIARGDDYRRPAVTALEPVLRAARDWDGVVELLELALAVEDAVDRRLATLSEVARIEEVERHEAGRAFAAWARALTEEATDEAPRQALERLAAASRDFANLARVYEERMEATFDAALQRSLAVRLADLYETSLANLDRAAEFLRKALSLPGDEAEVLAALERVLRKQGAHADLAETLAREAEVASDPGAQADFLAALGEVRLRSLDDADGALGAFRDALERNPDHGPARAALRELLGRPEVREAALDVLEPMAESRGEYQELVTLYEHRLTLRDDRTERAHWLRKIAEVCDGQLHDPARALEALGRALGEEPMPGGTVDELERIAIGAKVPGDAAARIEEALAAAEPDAARELALRAARLHEQAGDGAAAERLYVRVLDGDPENADALVALEALYRAAADGLRLAAVLERRAAVELDPESRKRFLSEAARLHERRGDPAAAVAAWQALRAADESDTDALGELARLYEAAGQIPDLAASLAERARFTDDPAQRAALWARVGELRAGPLSDVDGAAEAYREALDGAPAGSNLAAAILGALERLEEQRQDFTTLQEVLMRRLGAAASGAEQVPVLMKLAKNAETHLSDVDQAAGYLRQVLDVEPGNGFAYLELERILRSAERWYDLVEVLGKHAEVEGGAGRKPTELALRVAIADVWERELSSPESATEALEKVLALAPAHVPALLSLARLHEAAERWDEAGEALERAAAAVSGGSEAAEIHFRNAQILRARGAAASEIESLLLRALDADQRHKPTLEGLEAIAREAKDDERLAQLLELRLELAADDGERRKLLAEVAALYRGPLARPALAVPFLERLLAVAPDDLTAREELAESLVAADRPDEATRLIGQLVVDLTKARRGKDAARWYQRLGVIAEAKGDLAAAAESLTAAYKLDPSHPGTLAALGRLAFQRNDHDSARKFYRSLLLQNFDEASTGVSKGEVYLMLGRMHVAAREIPKARNMFERGLETDPKNAELKAALATLPTN
jgi:tetratricopeptide (TPR) repeat protein